MNTPHTESHGLRVNEIFYSLQGEGRYTGTPAVFLRLSGCNENCPFCDTQHLPHTILAEEEIVRRAAAYPSRHIVITGGEPTLQLSERLTALLHQAGFYIQIETNGSLPLAPGVEVDWITCSPKTRPIKIQRVDELKVLFPQDDPQRYDHISARVRCLQPLDTGNEEQNRHNLRLALDYLLAHPNWRLSLQTHKLLDIK